MVTASEAEVAAMKTAVATLQLFEMCGPSEEKLISLAVMREVLGTNLGGDSQVNAVFAHLKGTADGQVSFLYYWQAVDRFLEEEGGGGIALHGPDTVGGMQSFRDGILEIVARLRSQPDDAIPGRLIIDLLAQIRASSRDTAYWDQVMEAIPTEDDTGPTLLEVSEAIYVWLRDYLKSALEEACEDEGDSGDGPTLQSLIPNVAIDGADSRAESQCSDDVTRDCKRLPNTMPPPSPGGDENTAVFQLLDMVDKDLPDEAADSQEAINMLKRAWKELNASNSAKAREVLRLKEKCKGFMKRVEDLEDSVPLVTQQPSILTGGRKSRKSRDDAFDDKQAQEKCEEVRLLTEHCERVEKECAELRHKDTEWHERYRKLQESLDQSESQVDWLRSKQTGRSLTETSELLAVACQTEGDASAERDDFEMAQAVAEGLQKRLTECEGELEVSLKEMHLRGVQLVEERKERDALLAKIGSLNRELSDRSAAVDLSALAAAEEKVASIDVELERVRSSAANAAELADLQLASKEEQLLSVGRERDALQRKIIILEDETKGKLDLFEGQRAQDQVAMKAMEQKLKAAEVDLVQERDAAASIAKDRLVEKGFYEQQLSQLSQQCSDLKNQVTAFEAEAKARLQSVGDADAAGRAEIKALELRLKVAEEQLKREQESAASVHTSLVASKAELQALEQRLKGAETQLRSEQEAAAAALASAIAEASVLRKDVAEKKRELKEATLGLTALEEEIVALKATQERRTSISANAAKDSDAQKALVEQLTAEIAELRFVCQRHSATIAETERELALRDERLEDLHAKRNQAEEGRSLVTKESKLMQDQVQAQQAEIGMLRATLGRVAQTEGKDDHVDEDDPDACPDRLKVERKNRYLQYVIQNLVRHTQEIEKLLDAWRDCRSETAPSPEAKRRMSIKQVQDDTSLVFDELSERLHTLEVQKIDVDRELRSLTDLCRRQEKEISRLREIEKASGAASTFSTMVPTKRSSISGASSDAGSEAHSGFDFLSGAATSAGLRTSPKVFSLDPTTPKESESKPLVTPLRKMVDEKQKKQKGKAEERDLASWTHSMAGVASALAAMSMVNAAGKLKEKEKDKDRKDDKDKNNFKRSGPKFSFA